ncbi:hypothetical protein ANCCAN_06479 [Ancylostoma caninum]|uniref:Peptidase M1 membrane alanine aminopeptidase domain-containing protein n=1 Tax=Ancylostoma caninum TaxID=29170 RepID=A0A368GV16_ANCCA|nr:hypothetical protein ANCCAN_06479 [Ancylostoma caninum]
MVGVLDYSAGAMENWGLITFRQDILVSGLTGIILDPWVNDGRRDVIAHELAHQAQVRHQNVESAEVNVEKDTR